ncbi:hypothetical protein MLP_42380 [Microlunatus phosphovorus NM-1]|uniref:Uncharacterized protein n=1 Tax=Microlunatus phosphovorus (strain ATCC 700054 / DSM 10555 / JCM 9379 / NBRC 101784 / NCIMB 13414 / VKM Ac-1990 / NM-1) TaxID=1032480 RepID=F5XSJ4_MICPN|nr:hypothetical protein [Microlunatus phosphovorus]BAK37252.1 hypothetical protein MLP_42380 [Microlunatus phosphovorus NM-1]
MVADTSIELLVEVLDTDPLRLHVSLQLPDAAAEPVWVPRLLRPVGAFVRVDVRNTAGDSVFATDVPKFKPKLKPSRNDSYLPLDPGYSYGTVLNLDLDLDEITRGAYLIEVSYTNLVYQGTEDRPVGELALSTSCEVTLGR